MKSKDLQKATISGRTKVVFTTNTEDANEMSKYFPPQGGTVGPFTNMVDRLPVRASDYPPAVQNFIKYYLRQLDTELKSGNNKGKMDLPAHLKWNWLHGGVGMVQDWWDDPTPELNNILYGA